MAGVRIAHGTASTVTRAYLDACRSDPEFCQILHKLSLPAAYEASYGKSQLPRPIFMDATALDQLGTDLITLHNLLISGGLTAPQRRQLSRAAARLSAKVMRWKRTHYSIALRMLGDEQTGTGYTEGTPYLAAVSTIPIFRSAASEDATCPTARSAGD